jgi:hypothetical protein
VILSYRGDPKVPFQLYVLPFDPVALAPTGPPRQIGDAVIGGDFSPDGRYFLYSETGRGQTAPITAWTQVASPHPASVSWPLDEGFRRSMPELSQQFFAADGQWVVFTGDDAQHESQLFVVRLGGAMPQRIWNAGRFGGAFPQAGTDPRRIYFWTNGGGGTQNVLNFVPFDPTTGRATSPSQRLAFEPGSGIPGLGAAFTRDRRWMFFDWTEEEGDVYLAKVIAK